MNLKNILYRKFNVSKLDFLNNTVKDISLTEKTILILLTTIFSISVLTMLYKINEGFIVEIPAKGGFLSEGIIGSPRFINPLLATSNADRDLTTLIYSGLMKATPEGNLIPDLAESYIISDDGLEYIFKLKDNVSFHDGFPLTTEDVEFTIKLSQDSIIKSSKRPNWDGIIIEKINQKEIKFILKTPYSPFLENTTIGILPKHIWESIAPEQFAFSNFNIEPIGSGPYKITDIDRNSNGILEKYSLASFEKYTLGEPYISKLTINFYSNEENLITAYKKNNIEAINTISPENVLEFEEKNKRIERVPLPRIFGVFFNQNQNSIFTYKEVRIALNRAIDKERVVNEILNGYGISINNPVPLISKYYDGSLSEKTLDVEGAVEILEKNGWKLNKETGIREKIISKVATPLEFTISTSDAPELKAVSNIVKEEWEKIGAKVNIKIFEIGDLNQNVIRPRDYEALLFGEIIGRDMDLFAFWHSSQRNDPGLNIALYANITTDKLLEDARKSIDEEERIKKYKTFQKEVLNDIPAIFIYSPDFIYIIPEKIQNFSLGQITVPAERFLSVHNWNIKTNKVWKIFAPTN